MYFSYFSLILIFKANQSWTIQLSCFSAQGPVTCSASAQSPALSSHPVTSSSACKEQECCSHQWWRAIAQPRGGKGILGTVGSSLTKPDRQESQSSAKSNPSSAYDWDSSAHCRHSGSVRNQFPNNKLPCNLIIWNGVFFLFFLPLWWVFLVVLGVFLSAKKVNASPAASNTHHSYAEIQTYIVCEAVVQLAFNFGTSWFTCNLFSRCSPQQWDSTSTRKDLEQFWTLLKHIYMRELQISWKFFMLVAFWFRICRCSPWLQYHKPKQK